MAPLKQETIDRIGNLSTDARKNLLGGIDEAGKTEEFKSAIEETQTQQTNQMQEPVKPLNAADYNSQARDEGREDWRTAYRSDVLNIQDTETTPEPTVTDTTQKPTSDSQVFNVEDFKSRGSNLSELENVIEDKYNTVATNQNGKLVANINGVDYQWNLDNEGNPIKTKLGGESEQDIFSRMMGGEQFDDTGIKTTKEYQIAEQRKANLNKYTNMSHEDLSYQIGETLLPGTKEYEDLKNYNPELFQKAEDLRNLNSVNNLMQGKEETAMTMEQMISKSLMDIINPANVNDYKTVLSQDPIVIETKDKLAEKDLEVNELADQLENIEEDIEADLNGAFISKSRKNALITERAKGLDRQYRLKLAERDVLAGKLKSRAEDLQYDFEQQQVKRAEQLQNFQLMYQLYQDQISGTQPVTAWSKLNDGTLYNQVTGETKNILTTSTTDTGKWSKLDDNTLYNDVTAKFMDRNTGIATDSDGTVDYSTVDFTNNQALINQFPNEASFKNNNPNGITFNAASQELKDLWTQAGVNFGIGTARPSNEGGNYVKFASVQDGMDAYMIALTQRGDDVNARLQKWVGTSEGPTYAANLMKQAGIQDGAKFSELSDEQLSALMSAQLQKESPNFYNALTGEAERQTSQTGDNVELFNYADTLTASDRTKFLKERGIEDQYIQYRGNQGTGDFELTDIQDISEIKFPEKTTEFKTKSFGFGNRMDTSDDVIRKMEDKYKDSWATTEILAPRGEWVPNFLKTSERQQYEQARRNFVNAVLRQESGAVIADSEFENAAKQYFPAAGDSKDTIEQKRANREQVILNMYRSSGKDEKGRNIGDIYMKLNNVEAGNTKDLNSYFEEEKISQDNSGAGATNPNTFITY